MWVEQVSRRRSVAMVLDFSLCFKISDRLRGQRLCSCHPSDLQSKVTFLCAAFDLRYDVSREIKTVFAVTKW